MSPNTKNSHTGRLPHVKAWPDDFGDRLPVSELFYSLQGEGRFAGYPAVFIRLKYCNLGCAWCDTRFTWDPAKIELGELLDIDSIAEHAMQLIGEKTIKPETVHVVITGGEPMLHAAQLPALITALRRRGIDFVEIETNGMYVPDERLAELVSWWNCSPKLSNNGLSMDINLRREAIWAVAATGRADFKFVVMKPGDIDEIIEHYLPIIPPESIILMPEGMTARKQMNNMPWVLEACARHGFRFGPRLHILAWGNERQR